MLANIKLSIGRVSSVLVITSLFLVSCNSVEPQPTSLAEQDSVAIVKAVMDNHKEVFSNLNVAKIRRENRKPTAQEALTALLGVKSLDPKTRRSIELVLRKLPEQEKSLEDMFRTDRDDLLEFERILLEVPDASELPDFLDRKALELNQRGKKALATGSELAKRMLREGSKSIFSPEYAFYTELPLTGAGQLMAQEKKENGAKKVAKRAAFACVGGAVAGSPGGIAGAAIGCATGAVAGAVEAVVEMIWDSIF